MALPIGWSQKEFDDWYTVVAGEAQAEYEKTVRTRSEPELQVNVEEWLATGATSSALPRAWSSLEFTDWMAALHREAEQVSDQYLLSRTPQELIPDVVERMAWTPDDLGASLLARWDAERSDLITHAAGLVSSWRDSVGAYNAVQATGANQPVWSATSFGGRPGITSDGVSDELTLVPVPAGIPTGATPCEVWALCSQTLATADATLRSVVGWGNASPASRLLFRTVVTGVNRARVSGGDGTTQHTSTNTSVDLTGRHVMRGIFSGTAVQMDVDGVASAPVGDVHVTAANRLRLLAAAATTAANFWQGTLSTALITAPLTAQQASLMYGFLNARL